MIAKRNWTPVFRIGRFNGTVYSWRVDVDWNLMVNKGVFFFFFCCRCKHGAKCTPSSNYLDFACHCSIGWGGRLCNEDVDECMMLPCRNGATCQNTNGSYHCVCARGYEGRDCLINTDDCASCMYTVRRNELDGVFAVWNCFNEDVPYFCFYSPMSKWRNLFGWYRKLYLPLRGWFYREALRNRRRRM